MLVNSQHSPLRSKSAPVSPTRREDDPLKSIVDKKTTFQHLYNVIFFKTQEEYPSILYLQRYLKFIKKNLKVYSDYFRSQRLQYLAIIEIKSRGNQCRLALLSDNIEVSRLNITIVESIALYEDICEESLLSNIETDDILFTPSNSGKMTYSQVIAQKECLNDSSGPTNVENLETSLNTVTKVTSGTMTEEIVHISEEKEQHNLINNVFSLPPEAFIRACEKLGNDKLSVLIEKFSHAKQLLEL